MSAPTDLDPKELRPLLHAEIDRLRDADLALAHRVLLEIELQHVADELDDAADAGDDKFADCAIAAEADFIITEDRHFDALRGSGYKPQPLAPEEFIRRHLQGG